MTKTVLRRGWNFGLISWALGFSNVNAPRRATALIRTPMANTNVPYHANCQHLVPITIGLENYNFRYKYFLFYSIPQLAASKKHLFPIR